MPEPITWDPLAKNINDNTTIDEEIDATLLAHNLDPSAHSQSSEAIFAHKNAPVLDHVDGSIYNAHIQTANKTYDAIVDAAGNADFDDIQDAIDFVATLGGGTIFVRSGSYDIYLGLTLYSHIKLIGEDNAATILHGVGDDLWVLIQGTEEEDITDVLIKNLKFTDLYVDDPLVLMGYANDIHVEDCIFSFPNGADWRPNVCIGTSGPLTKIYIDNNHFEDFATAIYLPVASVVKIERNYFGKYRGDCIDLYNMDDCMVFNNYFDDNYVSNVTDAVIYAESNAGNIRIISNIFASTHAGCISIGDMVGGIIANNQILGNAGNGYGINVWIANYSIISGNFVTGCGNDGIFIDYNSNRNTIVGNTSYNNTGTGIVINTSDCDKNVVVANVCYSNTAGNLINLGTGTVNANNVTT